MGALHSFVRRWARALPTRVAVGAGVGVALALAVHGGRVGGAYGWLAVVRSVVYTVVLWTVVVETKRCTARVPLASWRAVSVHIAAISAVATVAFAALAGVDHVVLRALTGGGPDHAHGPWTALTASVALVFTLVLTSLVYLAEFYRRLRDSEQARLEAELRALRAQVDPHFLFNALNSIAALVRASPREAEGVTERLADLFRYTLRSSQRRTVPLADEVEAVRRYVDIEAVRFRDRLSVTFDVDPSALDAEVPSLLVLPLVENAVKHGVARTDGPCAVRVRAALVGGVVEVGVRDTGPGFDSVDADAVLARGTGLANVRDRLRLLYSDGAALSIRPDGVVLRFPHRPVGLARPAPARAPQAVP